MDDDLKEILINIRALITSSKGSVSLRDLIRDYETEVGTPIPYRKYGHSSVEIFLQSLPSLRVCGTGSYAVVEAASSQQSQHMSSLIAFQKSKRSRSVPPRRGGFSSRPYRGTRGYSHSRYSSTYRAPPPISAPSYRPSLPNYASAYRPQRPISTSRNYSSTSYAPPRFQTYNNQDNEPLVIKVEGNKQRQVSWLMESKNVLITIQNNQA